MTTGSFNSVAGGQSWVQLVVNLYQVRQFLNQQNSRPTLDNAQQWMALRSEGKKTTNTPNPPFSVRHFSSSWENVITDLSILWEAIYRPTDTHVKFNFKKCCVWLLIIVFIICVCVCLCLQLHNCHNDLSKGFVERSFPLHASNYYTFIQIMVLSGKQDNILISMDHHILLFATTLGLLGGFKQPHLARVRLIGLWGWVRLHTCWVEQSLCTG